MAGHTPTIGSQNSHGESQLTVRQRQESYTDNTDELYDPCQPIEDRRRVQKSFRDLLRGVTEHSEDYLQNDSSGLKDAILQATELSKQIRQTTEATIDSRLLVSTTDLSYKKTLRLTQGSLSQGIDVDEYVSKCVSYMREGDNSLAHDSTGPERPLLTRRRTSALAAEEDEELGDEGDMMDWFYLGSKACLPYVRRPALPGFFVGPLSVERKVRKLSKRSAPFRPHSLTETRPEVLNVDDLATRENDLTALCSRILEQLVQLQISVQEAVADAIEDDMDDSEKTRIMHEQGLRSTGGIDLMRFVTNPKSFGQTIENLFYVSFLIRDGRVEIDFDENDLPAVGKYNSTVVPNISLTCHLQPRSFARQRMIIW